MQLLCPQQFKRPFRDDKSPLAIGPVLSDARLRGVEGKRVEVLFLGHTRATEATNPKAGGWYHDSDRFAPILKAALAPDGFNFSYTTDAADLNAATLAKYDALLTSVEFLPFLLFTLPAGVWVAHAAYFVARSSSCG